MRQKKILSVNYRPYQHDSEDFITTFYNKNSASVKEKNFLMDVAAPDIITH